MFQPLGVIFNIIKYGIVQGTSEVVTYGIPWYYSALVIKYIL